MLKYTVVQQAPSELPKGTMVIRQPDFLDEIRKVAKFRGTSTVTTINYLRAIITEIAKKYAPLMNIYRDINLSLYRGLAYNTDEEVSAIMVNIIKTQKPELFDLAVQYQVNNRPQAIKLIYFIAPDYTMTGSFMRQGIDIVQQDEVESYLKGDKKSKKTKQEDTSVQ